MSCRRLLEARQLPGWLLRAPEAGTGFRDIGQKIRVTSASAAESGMHNGHGSMKIPIMESARRFAISMRDLSSSGWPFVDAGSRSEFPTRKCQLQICISSHSTRTHTRRSTVHLSELNPSGGCREDWRNAHDAESDLRSSRESCQTAAGDRDAGTPHQGPLAAADVTSCRTSRESRCLS